MKPVLSLALALGVGLVACAPRSPGTLTVMTHDSFAVSESVVQEFEVREGVQVAFLPSGDTGAALNKAILTRDAPLADVFFGVDNTFLSRAIEADLFEPYRSPGLAAIPDEFKLDPSGQLSPVDYGDVCINYDRAYFEAAGLAVPGSLEDLLLPEYRGLLVMPNPATSSPGLAFLLASVAHYGDPGYLEFWARMRDNGLVVVGDWETAYYSNFSASSGNGPQPMVVSYGSSPPAEVYFAEIEMDEAPTAAIVAPGTCFRQIEFAGILKGTPARAQAEAWIDFMLGRTFQEDLPLQMFVFPVHPQAALPEVFLEFARVPDQPASLPPARIAQNRETWISAWSQTVLR